MSEFLHPGSSSDFARARSVEPLFDIVRDIQGLGSELRALRSELRSEIRSVVRSELRSAIESEPEWRGDDTQRKHQEQISDIARRGKELEDTEQQTISAIDPQVRQSWRWNFALSSTSRSDPRDEDTTSGERGLLSHSDVSRDLPSRSLNRESASDEAPQLRLETVSPTPQPFSRRVAPPPIIERTRPLEPLEPPERRFEWTLSQ